MPPMSRKPPSTGRKLESTGVRSGRARKGKAPAPALGRTQSPAVDLGRTARRLRESQNLTLADVARRADISSAMLSRLETVRSGTRRGHTYHLLAAQRGPRKIFEPFLVTLNDRSEVFPGFQHPGIEFIHLLSGVLHYRHGRHTYVLRSGDSLTFSGDIAHGPERLEKVPIRMLSLIIYGNEDD